MTAFGSNAGEAQGLTTGRQLTAGRQQFPCPVSIGLLAKCQQLVRQFQRGRIRIGNHSITLGQCHRCVQLCV